MRTHISRQSACRAEHNAQHTHIGDIEIDLYSTRPQTRTPQTDARFRKTIFDHLPAIVSPVHRFIAIQIIAQSASVASMVVTNAHGFRRPCSICRFADISLWFYSKWTEKKWINNIYGNYYVCWITFSCLATHSHTRILWMRSKP